MVGSLLIYMIPIIGLFNKIISYVFNLVLTIHNGRWVFPVSFNTCYSITEKKKKNMGLKITYIKFKARVYSLLIVLTLNKWIDLSESQFAHL